MWYFLASFEQNNLMKTCLITVLEFSEDLGLHDYESAKKIRKQKKQEDGRWRFPTAADLDQVRREGVPGFTEDPYWITDEWENLMPRKLDTMYVHPAGEHNLR